MNTPDGCPGKGRAAIRTAELAFSIIRKLTRAQGIGADRTSSVCLDDPLNSFQKNFVCIVSPNDIEHWV